MRTRTYRFLVTLCIVLLSVPGATRAQTQDLTVQVEADWTVHHAKADFDSVVDAAVAHFTVSNDAPIPITLHSHQAMEGTAGVVVLGPVTTDVRTPCDDNVCTIEPGRYGRQMPPIIAEVLVSSFLSRGTFGGASYVLLPGAKHTFVLVFVSQKQETYESVPLEFRVSTTNDSQMLPVPLRVGADDGQIYVKPADPNGV